MMDRLGIGSFFPSLGESTRSALESNSYVSTRIEDILSKLQGSLASNDADQLFDNTTGPTTPEAINLANNLQRNEDEETKRKDLRKQREMARDEAAAQKPEQAAELAGPAAVEPQAPVVNRRPQQPVV